MTEAQGSAVGRAGPRQPVRHLDRLLTDRSELRPDAVALRAPGAAPLTYAGLRRQADRTASALRALGVGRADRVALAVPNGATAAAAFVAVACAAAAAPLDPAGQSREFDHILAAMDAAALIVERGADTRATAVARAQGRRVIELVPAADGPAGTFDLVADTYRDAVGDPPPAARPAGTGTESPADAADTAFIMHTSGTTGRPKLVPLTHEIVCASARNIAASLGLGEQDRCLNVLPLFHGHGLMSPLLATLWSGGSVVCPPGFDAAAFPDWLREFAPTWYTAVPAIHQAAVGAVAGRAAPPGGSGLRFVRSASAPLPAQLRERVERVLGAPLIDSYGMTEACSIITSNPLPPAVRKPGSVGVSIGNDVAVMGDSGDLLAAGEIGEIVLRGATVVRGYADDPAATAAAFTDGWFRTGDCGYLDEDGFLFLTGRLKEIINRGGTKVSPAEVDEVLQAHPAIAEAAAFPLPHATLGEEVAAAVVVRDGSDVGDDEIRAFAAARLAEPKVPRRIFRLGTLPRTATGKVRRSDLAGTVLPASGPGPEAPRTPMEQTVARVWTDVLGLDRVGKDDHFFDLGGNSLLIKQVQVRLSEATGRDIAVVELFAHPTVRTLSDHLGRTEDDLTAPRPGHDPAAGGGRLVLQLQQRRRQKDAEL
ncbi:MAG: non-ribosomal peptide synthetase [Catenulispora sp.]